MSGTLRPAWAWWGRGLALSARHAARTVERGGVLEHLVLGGGKPLDRGLQEFQRAHPKMGRNDRLVLGTAVYGLARNRETLCRALPDAEPGKGGLLLLALLDALGGSADRVAGLPGGPERWTEALARLEALRRAAAERVESGASEPAVAPSPGVAQAFLELFGVPAWWLELGPWRTIGEAAGELGRLKQPQQLTLRVNLHRAGRDAVLAGLAALGIPASPTPRSPWGARVEGRHNVLSTELFRQGWVEVQDEGSQLIACLCDPKPTERVLDYCAGGGGKSLAMAAALRGRGSVVAHDPDRRKLEDARRRARRSGLGNIRTAESAAEVERLGPYDLVLVDAPCSSSGTLRRNPDAAWRWDRPSLERLTALQARILDAAAPLVRPGGILVYATCSLLEPENALQVSSFTERHPAFAPFAPGERQAHAPLLDVPGASAAAFRLAADLPSYTGDAYFMARLRRADEGG